ncbi:hypothetical protein DB30_04686 [Enhygromyxa salina]|uniref:Bacterial virulence factor lipase N-terminal domain-containing protein n=1 Tax=Enhygromyxa salina TaxID=215803 RepID=A0A0C2D7Z0_9BACT|nr:hypothetical protein [Enhygromyxa salina]KIG19221.1 hypothetical protein DB30_04686 [Enhygromyxa salina]
MTSPALPRTLLLASSLTILFACTDDTPADTSDGTGTETSDTTTGDGDGDSTEVDPFVAWPTLDCDPLVPDLCGLPFPNNVFTIDDPDSPTGRRLAFTEALVPEGDGYQPDPDVWLDSDGFSPGSALLTYFPNVSIQGLPTPVTIEVSLSDDSPTILLDADSGERVPHWAELDMSHGDDGRRAFMIRPAVRLDPNTRYIVAIRGLVDQGGALIEASSGFAALRDISPSDDDTIEQRRGLYADIFMRLGDAGIGRADLQLAWDFTTASDANITERLVHVRDEGLAMFDAGPQFNITKIDIDPFPGIAMRVTGDLLVPLYLDEPGPAGRFTYGADGLPEPNTTTEYPFMVLIPTSAFSEPAGLLQFGHGLFGSYQDVDDSLLRDMAIDYNLVPFATTWLGLSNQDLGQISSVLQSARIDDFSTIVDRLGQGVFNGLSAMRMMRESFADAPEIMGPSMEPLLIDADRSYFFGASLGGIMGSTYMALTTDVQRGVLGVPGQPYGLLLDRSEAFTPLATLSNAAYEDKLDLRIAFELMQILWDRSEPTGFSRHVISDPLPGTQPHEVIMLGAIGDHLVTNFGTHVMARELGIPQLNPAVRPLFGIDQVEQPYSGSVFIEYDFGLPPIPITNVPMTQGSDPHGALADVPNAILTVEQFLRTGVVENFCNGTCDPD